MTSDHGRLLGSRAAIVLGVAAWLVAAGLLLLDVVSGPAQQSITIRWSAATTELTRQAAERALKLEQGEETEPGKWVYRLRDRSRALVQRIVTHPLIADTDHIDRESFRVAIDAPGIPRPVRRFLEADFAIPVSAALGLAGLLLLWAGRAELARVSAALTAAGGRVELVCALTALVIGFVFFADNGPGVDENVHYDQIVRLAEGRWSMNPALTMIPGFHAVVAGMEWAIGGPGEYSTRVVVLVISLATVIAFFALARALHPERAGVLTLQFTFLPVLFPQFFLIYTDVISLLFVLLMMLAAVRRRPWLSGLFGAIACLMRQNDVIWVAFALAWSYLRDHGWSWRPLRESLARYWTYVAAGTAFLVFVALNGGEVALGDDAGSHPLGTLHFTNLLFMLALSGVGFLPLWWGYRHRFGAVMRRPWPWVWLVVLFVTFWFGWSNDHPHNNERADYFLPNAALIYFSSTPVRRLWLFLPIAIAGLGLAATPLRRPWWLLLPFSVLFLLPEWLVVPRYYLIPWSLFLVAREPATLWAERLQVAVFAVLGVWGYLIVERAWGWI